MVLPRLFSRSPDKKSKKTPDDASDGAKSPPKHKRSDSTSSLPLSPRTSPKKSSSSPTKSRSGLGAFDRPSSSRSSRSFTRSTPHLNYDPDSHPLNLHPDELRRLTAMESVGDDGARSEMDVDQEQPTTSTPSTPLPQTPGAFQNGMMDERSPTPPPHRSPLPPPKPPVDAEACKAAGNKFFKAKDYDRAIKEYTKGMRPPTHIIWILF
jgi:DnaJ family protein C protein 7